MSRKLKLGSETLGKIIDDIQDTCLLYTEEPIPYPLWVTNLNEAVYELFDLSGWRKLSEYRDSVPIPILKKVYSNTVTGSNYNALLFVLTVPAGAIWTNAIGFDSNWMGADGRTGARGQISNLSTGISYPVVVTAVMDANNVTIAPLGAVPPSITATNLVVNLDTTVNNEANDIDLTLLPDYKNLDRLEKITSTAVRNGLCVFGEDEMGQLKCSSKNFEVMKNSSNYKDQVIGYRQGELIRMSRGSNLTTYGTRTLYFTTYPVAMVEDTDLIDVRNVDIPKVKKYTLIRTLGNLPQERFKVALPQVDLDWFQTLQGSRQAAVEKKANVE